jgi:hypothetical protein
MATKTNKTTTADYTGLADALRSIADQSTTLMKNFATAQKARSVRLTAVRDRLRKSAKTSPAVMTKLDAAISASSAVAQNVGALADRIARRPAVDPADPAVFGNVADATGAPAANLYVRLSDSAGKLKAGSRAKTDASGDFSLVFKSCEVPESEQGLVVAVEDAGGKRLASSGPITPKAGSPVYVELTLPAGKPASTKTSSLS